MAITLTLVDTASGGESCDFSAGTAYKWRKGGFWCPAPALKPGQTLVAGDPEDRYESREVQLHFKVTGASEDAIWDNIAKIDKLLFAAREQFESMIAPTVELRWKSNGATNTTYFIVLGGSVDTGPVEHLQLGQLVLPNCTLTLTCRPFARGVGIGGTLIAVALDNSSTDPKTTDPVTVYNHDDATSGHDNYVDIAKGDVKGDQPAEVEIKMVNHASSPNDLYRFHVAVRVLGDPTNMVFALNVEDNFSLYDTSLADDSTSPGTGGSGGIGRKAVTDFSLLETWVQRVKWRIAAADVDVYEGIFRIYAAIRQTAGSSGDIEARIVIDSSTQYVYGDAVDPVVTGSYWPWTDMGLFAIPVTTLLPSAADTHDIWIGARRNTGAADLEMAAIMLVPVKDPDRYLLSTVTGVMSVTSADVSQGANVLHRSDYSPHHGTYSRTSGDVEELKQEQRGPSLFLSPHRDQRLFFAMAHTTQTDGSQPRYGITNRLQVTVKHNPRFLHVRGTA